MFEIVTSSKFLKDLKLLKKRSIKDFQLLQELVITLAESGHKVLTKNIIPTNSTANIKAIGNFM
jgi:mRNA interferase YafQ